MRDVYRRDADHKADLVDELFLDKPIEGPGAFRFICHLYLLSVVPDSVGPLILGVFMVEIHAETFALTDEYAVPGVADVFPEAVVQEPFEIDDLRGHPRLDVPFTGKGTEPFVQALQRIETALHEQDEPPAGEVMRHEAVDQPVNGQLISHDSLFSG